MLDFQTLTLVITITKPVVEKLYKLMRLFYLNMKMFFFHCSTDLLSTDNECYMEKTIYIKSFLFLTHTHKGIL